MPRYRAGLGSTLQGAVVPYGYTLTVWCSGQFLSDLRGQPRLPLVLGFVAGAVTAFGLLRWVAREPMPLPGRPHVLAAAFVQVAAIGAAVGAVAALGHIPSGIDWPLAGFAATGIYLTGTAASMALRADSV
jgi:hypothetical protein